MLKRQYRWGTLGVVLAAVSCGIVCGCENPFAQCEPGFDCPSDDEGPQAGGTSPGGETSGGSSSDGGATSGGTGGGEAGGTPNVGGAPSGGQGGEPSGGAPPQPCDGKCKDETPLCDEETDTCVGCFDHSNCTEKTTPMCSLDRECVGCSDQFSCGDTLGLVDTPACLDGTEDEETGEVRDHTGECVECASSTNCDGDICDPETHTCLVGLKYRTKDVCQSCANDLECKEGQLCVEQKFDGTSVGSYCTWTKEALVGISGSCLSDSAGPPFVKTQTIASVGGVSVPLCVLDRTTCPGYLDHLQQRAGCVDASETSDAACGAQEVDDGLCRQVPEDTSFLCTYRCGSTKDCLIKGTQYDCVGTNPAYCDLIRLEN